MHLGRNYSSQIVIDTTLKNPKVKLFALYHGYNQTSRSRKNKKTGEYLNDKYFGDSDMILVDEVSRARVEGVVQRLINKDELKFVFKQLEDR